MKNKSNKEIIEERAVNNPSYDESLDTAQRLGDFLGAFHLVMNGVVAHNPFTLKNEGKPNEMCDTEDKQRLIEFVELLITQALEQKEREVEEKYTQRVRELEKANKSLSKVALKNY